MAKVEVAGEEPTEQTTAQPDTGGLVSFPAPVAPGSRKTGRKGGQFGNTNAATHGIARSRWTRGERAERDEYEASLIADLGEKPSTAQYSLVHRASWLEMRLRRNERAGMEGKGEIVDEHLLAWINSQRLLLVALGLERRKRQGPDPSARLAAYQRGEK